MRKDAGFTVVEVIVATSVVALVMTSAMTAVLPGLAREKLRSTTYELQSTLQVSRIEAIARNSPTRFVMNSETRTVEVWDTRGTNGTADDELIRRFNLPSSVSLARPDSGDAVTIGEAKSASIREVTFSTDGSAPGSTGVITLYGGGQYRKLDLQAAGGVTVDRWIEDGWEKSELIDEEKLAELWDLAREGYEDRWTDTIGAGDPQEPPVDDGSFPYPTGPMTDNPIPPDGPAV